MSKREGCLSKDEAFMMTASLWAMRSKDPSTQVGAVIVNSEGRIISTGYNGMPTGMSNDLGLWGNCNDDPMQDKYPYVCHAELNAVANCTMMPRGGTIYVTHHPCNECTKLLIQSGIKRIVWRKKWANDTSSSASVRMLEYTGVVTEQYTGRVTI